jgi:hypothetical protein
MKVLRLRALRLPLVSVFGGKRVVLPAVLAVVGLALLLPASGFAVHNAACPLDGPGGTTTTHVGCLFELDGNVANDVASAGNNTGVDWAAGPGGPGVFDASGQQALNDPQLLKTDFSADYATPDTSYFATSAKDIDDVSTWQCGSVNNPTSKDEILNAYAALFSPSSGADAGHVILYAASERASNNGDSFMGFWLFKSGVSWCRCTAGTRRRRTRPTRSSCSSTATSATAPRTIRPSTRRAARPSSAPR